MGGKKVPRGQSTPHHGKRNIEYEPVDIPTLLHEIVSTTQERVQHEGYEIRLECQEGLPGVQADRASLSQAIHNLLDNAVKYSAGKKEVVVRVYSHQEQLVISVQDFGIGIEPQEIDRVFERFYRGGDQLTRAVRGSGLGLTLVKQITEAHRGTVIVESEPGKGSTFSIRLPLENEDWDNEQDFDYRRRRAHLDGFGRRSDARGI